jgi:dephospho-CoA kinase
VWNDGDKEDLRKQIDQVMAKVKSSSPQWWAFLLLLFPPLAVMSGSWSYVRSWWIKKQWEQEKLKDKAKL